MLVDIVIGLMGIVVHEFSNHELLQMWTELLSKFTQGGRRGHYHKMFEFAALCRVLKMRHDPRQKLLLALLMRIDPGLDCMAHRTYRLVNPWLTVSHQFVCR